jgi:cobalt-zinc-cadmium efflux system outer membrane protein
VCALLASGCSRGPVPDPWPAPRPLASQYEAYHAPQQAPDENSAFKGVVAEPRGELTLSDALALALVGNPDLAAFSWDVRAAEAHALQEGLWQNPEINLRVDDIGKAGGSYHEDERTRVILRQEFELGSKPSLRRQIAQSESELLGWDYEAKRLTVAMEVAQRFSELQGAQQRVELLRKSLEFMLDLQRTVAGRVQQGELPEIKSHQMARQVAAARIGLREAESRLATARQRLASRWGSTSPTFERAAGELVELPALPDSAQILALIEQSPAVARYEDDLARWQGEVSLARAGRLPDVRIGVGMRDEPDQDQRGFLMDFRVPLPFLDHNQGDLQEAIYQLARTRAQRADAMAAVASDAMRAYQQLATAHFAVQTLRAELLPAAQAEFRGIQEGFAENESTVGDILDGEKDVTRAELDYVDALVACHAALAWLEGVLGQPLATLPAR